MSSLAVTSTSTPQPLRLKIPNPSSSTLSLLPSSRRNYDSAHLVCNAASTDSGKGRGKEAKSQDRIEDEGWVEVEEDLPWIQDKAMDLVEFTGSITQAIPGPRVARTSLPWILALPLAYAGVSLVIAVVKTLRKLSSPDNARRKLVRKNALVCRTIDEILQREGDSLQHSHLSTLTKQTGFSIEAILRKYIRYALNEKPFNPNLISNLLHLRKASLLSDSAIADILNEISSRIVFEKGTHHSQFPLPALSSSSFFSRPCCDGHVEIHRAGVQKKDGCSSSIREDSLSHRASGVLLQGKFVGY